MFAASVPSREGLLHALYEAAELEHDLMCTYLYAAYSLKSEDDPGLSPRELDAVTRWRREILAVAIEEMSHLVAVWNITSALGGTPRFGRGNFPLDPGQLPAAVVVKLAPFSRATLQHFIHLERPRDSTEADGTGFVQPVAYKRPAMPARLTPMALDYQTIGVFYECLEDGLRAFIGHHGERGAFCGDRALQLSAREVALPGARDVVCLDTAISALTEIIEQGEGSAVASKKSHYCRFLAIRDELDALERDNPEFTPAHPAATNPVLRPPPRPEGRVWIEDDTAAATVDLANASYALMLRLLAHAYHLRRPAPAKQLVIDLALALMRAMTIVAERAARLPAGPSNPGCNAGMSFTVLRDVSPLPEGPSAARFFTERFEQLVASAAKLVGEPRMDRAHRMLVDAAARAARGFAQAATAPAVTPPQTPAPAPPPAAPATPIGGVVERAAPVPGVERVPGPGLDIVYEGKRCIHARHCVTGAPEVFLANVVGPWIHPEAMSTEDLVYIAKVCPSGAIRYDRHDGGPQEAAPPVNLIAIREHGPYAVRAAISIDGGPTQFRATLCRCGASKNKPYCDGSHHEVGFDASGEPATTPRTDMLAVRDGVLAIDPELDGPLAVRGNLEITSGTGRLVARVESARLCRCGGSATKPFCDNTHQRIGFRSGG